MDAGETLIEVVAAIVIIGITLVPAARLILQSIGWLGDLADREQALAYAKQGVQLVSQTQLTAYQQDVNQNPPVQWTPKAVTPPALPPVRGVSFTETISGPTAVPWASSKFTLYSWTVTVSWQEPNGGGQQSVSLSAVVDPAVSASG